MNFREILDADIARYEESYRQPSPKTVQDKSVKTNVELRRIKIIGEIVLKHFPDLECFQPQLNQAANEREFKPFEDFLVRISKYKPVEEARKKILAEHGGEESKAEV